MASVIKGAILDRSWGVGWGDWDSERESDLSKFKKSGGQRLAAFSSKPIPPSLLPPCLPKPQIGPVRGPLSTWQRLWTHQMLCTFFSWEHFPANLVITICSYQVLANGNWTRVICTNSGHNPWKLPVWPSVYSSFSHLCNWEHRTPEPWRIRKAVKQGSSDDCVKSAPTPCFGLWHEWVWYVKPLRFGGCYRS